MKTKINNLMEEAKEKRYVPQEEITCFNDLNIQQMKGIIKMANLEVKEWTKFIKLAGKRLKKLKANVKKAF